MTDVKPGIYLEVKKGKLGSAITAQDTEFKNFWLITVLDDGQIQLILLDHDFKPTGIREVKSASVLEGAKYSYIPQGEKRYQLLVKKYGDKLTKLAKPKPAGSVNNSAKQKKAGAAKKISWWQTKY